MAPARYKIAVVSWLGIYPLITLLLLLLGPLLAKLPLPLTTLVLTTILVPTTVFVVQPALLRLFAGWLRPRGTRCGEGLQGPEPDASGA